MDRELTNEVKLKLLNNNAKTLTNSKLDSLHFFFLNLVLISIKFSELFVFYFKFKKMENNGVVLLTTFGVFLGLTVLIGVVLPLLVDLFSFFD